MSLRFETSEFHHDAVYREVAYPCLIRWSLRCAEAGKRSWQSRRRRGAVLAP